METIKLGQPPRPTTTTTTTMPILQWPSYANGCLIWVFFVFRVAWTRKSLTQLYTVNCAIDSHCLRSARRTNNVTSLSCLEFNMEDGNNVTPTSRSLSDSQSRCQTKQLFQHLNPLKTHITTCHLRTSNACAVLGCTSFCFFPSQFIYSWVIHNPRAITTGIVGPRPVHLISSGSTTPGYSRYHVLVMDYPRTQICRPGRHGPRIQSLCHRVSPHFTCQFYVIKC